ncbi:uncharacterized protein LOC114335188 isoform X1 [Diabrotica virgifera virgifera]|uniref:Uncharacterized protein LOC114335188 isoform X1 n=1 Tax=Diabrotica virgifera virgifera TaxID=50390 RepID=A0A6P7G8L2_DIAVI|nr:uncharacterized protein LOC114335188 isoform X1 [Diabrotica virgifera virgifera]
MRSVFIVFVFLTIIALCSCAGTNHKLVKKHKHCHKWLILQKFYFLAFLAFKFKAILVIGSIWAITFIFGKVFAAFKLAEYMKGSNKHEVIYSSPHHFDHAYSKNLNVPPSSADYIYDYPSKGSSYPSEKSYPPTGYGRGYSEHENFTGFYDAFRRSNLTEVVFKDMDLKTDACKRRFVCQADFNTKQSRLLGNIFNMFVDDVYKSYRSNETISAIEDCTTLYPACDEDDDPQDDT